MPSAPTCLNPEKTWVKKSPVCPIFSVVPCVMAWASFWNQVLPFRVPNRTQPMPGRATSNCLPSALWLEDLVRSPPLRRPSFSYSFHNELMARLQRELDRLGGRARELWDLLVRGMRLREIAAALDLSYDAAKRQRRKLIAHLRACLGEE